MTTVDNRAQSGLQTISLTGFVADGWTSGNEADVNSSANYFISWGWKAGGVPSANNKRRTNDSSSETTLSSSDTPSADQYTSTRGPTAFQQSVNSVGGFSITKYTAAAPNSGDTIKLPHGLDGTPAFVIIKYLGGAGQWAVWHQSLSNTAQGHLFLETNAVAANLTTVWGNTAPNSTHMHVGYMGETYWSGREYIMYAWKTVSGVSHFGTYEGTGSTMTETGLGFTPSFLLIKSIDGTDNWIMYDSFRGFGSSGNTDGAAVYANLNNAENASEVGITVSSGQFVMNNNNANVNTDGNDYIYAAFA